jgi:HAE1 family hydrophobic/amphiphilic exporter-1
MLASRFFKNGYHVDNRFLWQFMDKMEKRAVGLYRQALFWSLGHRKKLLLTILAVFAGVMALIPLGAVGTEFMPQTDESGFTINIQCPVRASSEEPNKVALQLEKKLSEIPEVKYYMTQAGGSSNSYEGRIKVQLLGRRERSRSVWEITQEVREYASHISGAEIRVTENQSNMGGPSGGRGGGGALQVELRGSNMQELAVAADKVEKILRHEVKGVGDVNSSYTEGMPELQLTVNRDKLKVFDASLADIDTAFSSAISGLSAGELKNDPLNGGQDTKIKVRFKGADGYHASDVARVPVWANGKLAYLGDVADIKDGRGPVSIRRVDKQRSIQLGANLRGRPVGDVVRDVKQILQETDLGEGVTYRFKGQASRMNETFGELISALFLALVLIYMLLAVLYESVLTPFIRMFSLPLGLIGSVLLLFLTHNTLNLYSMIGILVMDGIVAKNGTLLIDYTLTLMDRGRTALEAIVEAGCVRLKPICMTTITMMVGMLPMALAMTDGAETRVSMAWVIIGGLLTSTVFTLLVIPIIFLYFYQKKESARSS